MSKIRYLLSYDAYFSRCFNYMEQDNSGEYTRILKIVAMGSDWNVYENFQCLCLVARIFILNLSVTIVSQVMKSLLLNFSLINNSADYTESLVEYRHATVAKRLLLSRIPLFERYQA